MDEDGGAGGSRDLPVTGRTGPGSLRAVHQRLLTVLLASILLIAASLHRRPGGSDSSGTFFSPYSTQGYVKIAGDVSCPGVYPYYANIMTIDAIKMAGAVLPQPDGGSGADLLQAVRSGDAIHVRRNAGNAYTVTTGRMTVGELLTLEIPLDINEISEADLQKLPGVGPALARRIVSFRQNIGGLMAVTDLQKIEGVGSNKFHKLSVYFK